MRKTFLLIILFSIVLLLVLFASCTTQGPVEGSLENPLILDDYSGSEITYSGTIGKKNCILKLLTFPT